MNLKFSPRLTPPDKSDPRYYGTGNPFVAGGFGLPNCTCYAWGRYWENLQTAGITDPPMLQRSNAENWYNDEHFYRKGKTPKLGAIAVWRQGAYHTEEDGAGHVASVEQINDDGSFVCSGSALNGAEFRIENYNADGYKPGFILDGFIYLPFDYEDETKTQSATTNPDTTDLDTLKKENEALKIEVEALTKERQELKDKVELLNKEISNTKKNKFEYTVSKDAKYKIQINSEEELVIKSSETREFELRLLENDNLYIR